MFVFASIAERSVGSIVTVSILGVLAFGVVGLFVWFLLSDPDKTNQDSHDH